MLKYGKNRISKFQKDLGAGYRKVQAVAIHRATPKSFCFFGETEMFEVYRYILKCDICHKKLIAKVIEKRSSDKDALLKLAIKQGWLIRNSKKSHICNRCSK